MFRATMENAFSCDALDDIFAHTAKRKREGELLFSTVVGLLAVTVFGMRNSVHAAYRAVKDRVRVRTA
jgi:hypothetical protein